MLGLHATLREWRHNPCLMSPLSAGLLLLVIIFWFVSFVTKFPVILLSLVLNPLLNRFQFVVEFLYPISLGRWIHLTLVRFFSRTRKTLSRHDLNRGYHSRAVELRMEVIKGRVFVHPLCQLLDNLGYLVVCVPPSRSQSLKSNSPLGTISIVDENEVPPIVAFVVDCGDADSVLDQLDLISEVHYDKQPIMIKAVLSTHKHHDHTAGNQPLLSHARTKDTVKHIFGGAVEQVPGCNYTLANGDLVPLPKVGGNDMNDLVEVEAVATPGHTRGSLAYALRPKDIKNSSAAVLLFTGDTIFSAGKGVSFEADIDIDQEGKENGLTPVSFLRTSAGNYAAERCFSEILSRSVRPEMFSSASSDRILIMPGHEYTSELLARQLTQAVDDDACKWKNFPPAAFFETASHFYVSSHRRTLPHSSGKILCAPSSLRRELLVNPTLRKLKQRGDHILRAIHFWHTHFAREKIPEFPGQFSSGESTFGYLSTSHTTTHVNGAQSPEKTPSLFSRWNLDASDVDAPVFTTVYAEDLNMLIADLDAGRLTTQTAACRLQQMKTMLEIPPIGRRPIPNTLPSDRNVVKSLLGFALLGSTPNAMTLGDSEKMKLPPPIVSSSDKLLVSRKKLVTVLYWLGFLHEERDGPRIVAMIKLLWKEAREYSHNLATFDLELKATRSGATYENDEEKSMDSDFVELGALRWIIFGIPEKPPSWLGNYCNPCSAPVHPKRPHPVHKSGMLKNPGELVRHDIFACLLCRSSAGYPCAEAFADEDSYSTGQQHQELSLQRYSSSVTDEYDETCVEVSPQALGAKLCEF